MVIKRKFCDFFAILIPLEITCFAIMVVYFDIASNFEGLSAFRGNSKYVIAIWFAGSLYGGFHVLFAIYYFQSSVTLKITQQHAMLLNASQNKLNLTSKDLAFYQLNHSSQTY